MSIKERSKNIPELLAPAGTKEAFIAAVESGADAIYIGGEILNARMNAGNFSLPEMKEAIDFAHKRHVKAYVTVNTLVSDDEMPEALEYCRKLYAIGADALIIQDMGLGYVVKRYLPELPLHLSTQGSVYDLAGVEAAHKLGYERVVLARELSIKEIKNICDNTDVPVEVFCHGAICVCYSGQCQMSRAIGGRSGNRGSCAQPCRLAYTMKGGSSKAKKYYLSPSDMNLIDYIGELAEIGVSSLKIEGRMKSPEYVAVVTSIYRKYLDEYVEKGKYSVSEEDRLALEQIFNRGFTTAYLNGADERFMSGDTPKNKGVYMGKVIAVDSIKAKDDRFMVTAELNGTLCKNDVLEVGDSHCTVTFIEDCVPNAKSGKENGKDKRKNTSSVVRFGDVIGAVRVGEEIRRIVSDVQIREAEKSYKHKDWHEGKYKRKSHIDWDVVSMGEGNIKAIVKNGNVSAEVCDGPFEKSEGVNVSRRIRDALDKTGGTPFETRSIKLHGNFDYRIPLSALNAIRRNATAMLEAELCKVDRPDTNPVLEPVAEKEQSTRDVELYFFNSKDFIDDASIEKEVQIVAAGAPSVKILLPAADLIGCYDEACNKARSINAKIIPYINNISKEKENNCIEQNFNRICEIAEGGIYIGNLNWIERFAKAGVKVFGDYGLNKYNSYTEAALDTLGVSRMTGSLEVLGIESGNYGRVPLMTTEHSLGGKGLIDRKGVGYDIVGRDFSDQEIITAPATKSISRVVMELMKLSDVSKENIRVYI